MKISSVTIYDSRYIPNMQLMRFRYLKTISVEISELELSSY